MSFVIHQGDALSVLKTLPAESVHCCVTSPPYFGLRDYGVDGQLGLEKSPAEYIGNMVSVFSEVRRVLRSDGTLWVNMGDSYANDGKWGGRTGGKHVSALHGSPIGRGKRLTGLKPKDMLGIPWMLAFALREDGWYLRADIIWSKPNPMPESVTDRPTKAHEYIFLLTKSEKYFYDHVAIQEPSVTNDERRPYGSEGSWRLDGRPPEQRPNGKPRGKAGANALRGQGHSRYSDKGRANRNGRDLQQIGIGLSRNKRSVWSVATSPFPEAHFATFPPKLIEPCIGAGAPKDGIVLDPFSGAGTTGVVARRLHRSYIGIEINPEYVAMSERRIERDQPLFNRKAGEVTA